MSANMQRVNINITAPFRRAATKLHSQANAAKPMRVQQVTPRSALKTILYVLAVIGSVVLAWWLFTQRYIVLEIVFEQDENTHTLFSLLNGLLLGIYLNILGLTRALATKWRYVLIAAVCLFIFLDIGLIALRITFNLDLFVAKVYQTNSSIGAEFFVLNAHIFATLYVASLLVEVDEKS